MNIFQHKKHHKPSLLPAFISPMINLISSFIQWSYIENYRICIFMNNNENFRNERNISFLMKTEEMMNSCRKIKGVHLKELLTSQLLSAL